MMTDFENKLNIPFKETLKVWLQVALQSFGGPAGQISVMHRIIVEDKKWIDNDRFLHALNYCMLLPGPEAQQLAIYIGWLLHKFKGGLVAGILFVLPGFFSILILSIIYSFFQQTVFLNVLFSGLKAAVIAIVIDALIRIGRKSLKNNLMYLIAAGSFISIFFFNVPFPLIILAAVIIGISGGRFQEISSESFESDEGKEINFQLRKSFEYVRDVFLIFGGLWLVPVFILILVLGSEHIFSQLGIFFSTAATLTFGGAYAVLAYISQEAVTTHGWLRPGEMLDGLGMAETTPGPLIQVVQFVGYMGAFRLYEGNPLTGGVLASILVTWVTYLPSFLWVFAGAPFMEKLREVKLLNAALTAVTAAVTGVILNLSLWFFIHSAFRDVELINYGLLNFNFPVLNTLDWQMFLLSFVAFILLFRFKWSVLKVLALCAVAGIFRIFL